MEILIYIMGFIGGWIVHRELMIRSVTKSLQEIDQLNQDNQQDSEFFQVDCILEKYQDQYLLYQHPNGTFLAQGSSLDAMAKIVSERFQKPVALKIREVVNENSISQ